MSRLWKKTLSLILVGTLVVGSFAGCGKKDEKTASGDPVEATQEPEVEHIVREGIAFEDLEYVHYDPTEMEALIDETAGLMGDAANAETVLANFDKIVDMDYELAYSYELAELFNSLDATDEYYMDEYTYASDLLFEEGDKINLLGKHILESACGEAARGKWTEKDIKYYEEYVEMTDEQKELHSKESKLETEYNNKSLTEFTATINGKEYTLSDLYSDSNLSNEEYYDGLAQIQNAEVELLGPIYIDLVKVRQQYAKTLGYDNYANYAYEKVYERCYTPEDSAKLAQQVKATILEAYLEIYYNKYDYAAYSQASSMISEMEIADQMALVKEYLPKIDERLVDGFDFMEKYNLYDLDYNEKKTDGGFTIFLDTINQPFLFNQRGYSFYDFMTLTHEYGHYNNYYVHADEARDMSNLDLAEVHSQGLEILFGEFYEEMFGESAGQAAEAYGLLTFVNTVMDGCMYDEWQQYVYGLEDPTIEDISLKFNEIARSYGYNYEADQPSYDWVEIPHNFTSPIYYISYAVSVLPALEIWAISQTDFDKACDLYMKMVEFGEAEDFVKTVEAAGLTNPFSDGYIENITRVIVEWADEGVEETAE